MEGFHSIGEIIWHCIYWKMVLLERFKGKEKYRDETVELLNFRKRDALMKEEMQFLLNSLYTTSEEIIQFLKPKTIIFYWKKTAQELPLIILRKELCNMIFIIWDKLASCKK